MSSLFLSPKGLDCYAPMHEPNLVSHMFAVTGCKTCTKNQDFVIESPGIKQSDHPVTLFGLGQRWPLGKEYSPYHVVTCSYLTTSHVRQHSSARKQWTPHPMPMDLFDCAMISTQIFVAYGTYISLLNKVTLANGARSNSCPSMFTSKEIITYLRVPFQVHCAWEVG